MQQQAIQQGITPEEAQRQAAIAQAQQESIMQQQAAAQQVAENPQAASLNAYGGYVNKYEDGGKFLDFLKTLGFKNIKQLEDAGFKPSDFFGNKVTTWDAVNSNTELPVEFTWNTDWNSRVQSPVVKAALAKGWMPNKKEVGRKWYEGTNGNKTGWTASHGVKNLNAKQLQEYAGRYPTIQWALDNGILTAPTGSNTISTADIAEKMAQAPDWVNTDRWLYDNSAKGQNMAEYLGMARGLNEEDDTKFADSWKKWGNFIQDSEGNWKYNLNNLSDEELKAFTDYFKKSRTDGDIGVMYNSFIDPTALTGNYAIDKKGNIIT